MRKTLITATLTAAFGSVAMFTAAPPASADLSVHSPDDGAVCAWKSAMNRMHVKDNKSDGFSAYCQWFFSNDPRLVTGVFTSRGVGEVIPQLVAVPGGGGVRISYRACTDASNPGRPGPGDRCSGFITEAA